MYSTIRMVLNTRYSVQPCMDTCNLPSTSSRSTHVMCTAKPRCVCLLYCPLCTQAPHVHAFVSNTCMYVLSNSGADWRHSPLVMSGSVCQSFLCNGVCVSQMRTCPLLQGGWTLLHSTAAGGSVELFEWLMANYKFDAEAKTAVRNCYAHTCYTDVVGPFIPFHMGTVSQH